jgi:hypothetical protein
MNNDELKIHIGLLVPQTTHHNLANYQILDFEDKDLSLENKGNPRLWGGGSDHLIILVVGIVLDKAFRKAMELFLQGTEKALVDWIKDKVKSIAEKMWKKCGKQLVQTEIVDDGEDPRKPKILPNSSEKELKKNVGVVIVNNINYVYNLNIDGNSLFSEK